MALETMVQARNEGRDYVKEGPDILKQAVKGCKPLQAALDTWGETTCDYESTDTPDVVDIPTPSA